jgi:rubrerythrin
MRTTKKKKKCRFCKYTWTPIKENPVQCPNCKRYGFEKAKP